MTVAVCVKLVDSRPEVDPLTGEVTVDARAAGISEADQAALEWGLRLGETWGTPVLAVSAGPPPAEVVLRDALAAGAARAVRVDLEPDAPSAYVASALASVVAGSDVVLCGDWSIDRGSGSVPAFVAAHLDAAQALGLVELTAGPPGRLAALRRLDAGRRERLDISAPAVCSVEGRIRLRRASLEGVLAAGDAVVEVRQPPGGELGAAPCEAVRTGPYRPPARVLRPPEGDDARTRILALTGALVDRTPPERLVLEPPDAAERLLAQLVSWGYLDEVPAPPAPAGS